MENTNRNFLLISLIVLLGWFLFVLCCGEQIRVNHGLGWDGDFYARVALNPIEYITRIGVNNYKFCRVLPSIIVHYSAELVGYRLCTDSMTPDAVIHAFMVYNFLLITVSVFILYKIAQQLAWEPPIFVIAFTALFVNFPILKLSGYNPTTTDISAFAVSLLIFYLYLKKQQLLLFFVSLPAAFVWPTLVYTSLFLLIFTVQNLKQQQFVPTRVGTIASAIIAGLLAAGTVYDYYGNHLRLPNGATQVHEKVVIASVILFFMYVWLMLRPCMDVRYARSTIWSGINLRGVVLSLLLLIGVKTIIALFSKDVSTLTTLHQIRFMGQTMIVNPLVSVVAHVSYFGPGVILTLIFWRRVVLTAQRLGPGVMLFLLSSALLSIGSESRQSITAWPTIAILTCEALNRRGITRRMAYSLLLVALVTSRFWLNLNGTKEWTGPYTEFPYQMFFMNFGPWLSTSMYAVFAAIASLLSIGIYFSLRHQVNDAGN